jgi:predicted nucleic acid-binding protein
MRNYLMLLLLFAVVIGISLLNMIEDPKPTALMVGKSVIEAEVKKEIIPEPVIEEVIEAEVKKEIIPEPVIEEVIEPEIKTDPPELESAPRSIGVISEISEPLDKYYLIVASFLDNDLAFDYAKKLILSGSNVTIIPPFSTRKLTMVALEYETFDNKIFFIPTRRIYLKVVDDEIISNIGLDKYKDEFDEQSWVLKY